MNALQQKTNGQGDSALREIRIPSIFFLFLLGSGFLSLPKVKKMEGFNIWIDKNDPNLLPLIEAAKDYCKEHNGENSNIAFRGAQRLLWVVGSN